MLSEADRLTAGEQAKARRDLRALIERMGSQAKVARALGLSDAALSRFMDGQSGGSRRFRNIGEIGAEVIRRDAMIVARTLSSDDLRMILRERGE